MSPTPPHGAAAYARAVERLLAEASGRAVVLSPRDWGLLADWHARGVPIACLLEPLRARCAAGRPPRSLAALARAVEATWEAVRAGTSVGSAPEAAPRSRASASWKRAAERAADQPALRALIDRAIDRFATGERPAAIDGWVDAEIVLAASPDALASARGEAEAALRRFRERMSRDDFDHTLKRSIVDRLRLRYGLSRLVLGG